MDEEESDVELDEDNGEISENDDESVDNGDDEFEYDENGDIIIPEIVDDDPEESDEEESSDAETDPVDEKEREKDEPAADTETAETESEEDERDKRIAALQRELDALKTQSKDTLAKLGITSEDILEGLEKVAAESEDISLEEYRKKKSESQKNDEARRLLQKLEFEKMMKADLAEVQREFPETKGLKAITDIENFSKFGKLRDMGLSPKEAYAAANADSVRTSVATATKQQSLNETKAHLKSAVPKGSKDETIVMPKKVLSEWRDLFPSMNDKEIVRLYKESLKK